MPKNICFNPPDGSITLLLGLNCVSLIVSLFGVILTQYKSQFYVDSEVTRALYYGSSIFFWLVFLLSTAHVCFAMMQRKHLHRVSADYPEIDLRGGQKGKYLMAVLVLSFFAAAGGFGFGISAILYMETEGADAERFLVNDTTINTEPSNLSFLELSVIQMVTSPPTWENVQDRLACCSWVNVTDEFATGYCCENRDKSCPLTAPVPCRGPWLDEMSAFNLQVCALLLATGLLHIIAFMALVQLRCFSRSSLFKYSAYGASVTEKRKKERAMSLAVTQATLEKAAAAAAAASEDDPSRPLTTTPKAASSKAVAVAAANAVPHALHVNDKDASEAEKEPLTGGVSQTEP